MQAKRAFSHLSPLSDMAKVVETNYRIYLQQNNRPISEADEVLSDRASESSEISRSGEVDEDRQTDVSEKFVSPTIEQLSAPPLSSNLLEMVLYKKRDHLNTWALRYFVCDGEHIHYYLDTDEIFPKKSVLVDDFLKIQIDVIPIQIENQKKYSFTLTHNQMNLKYVLACNTMEDCLKWSQTIQSIQLRKETTPSPVKSLGKSQEETSISDQTETTPPIEKEPQAIFQTASLSDDIQYQVIERDSNRDQETPKSISLTRVVLYLLPLYYLTILWW
jgi:hypothetical protein